MCAKSAPSSPLNADLARHAERVSRVFTARGVPFESKRMMGGLVFMVRGKMCVGVESHRLMARIGPEAEAAALQRPGCTPMDFTGRPMRGFVFVDAGHLRTERQLASWLDLALAFNPNAKPSAKRRAARQPAR
jgi:TfoX/Sxy family transcriptional regulator of competence genes